MTDGGRWGARAERAVLVGVDLTGAVRRSRPNLDGARRAASRPEKSTTTETDESAGKPERVRVPDGQGLDADESLAEFRELVRSAGGEVAAEVMQRRPRPDPATLIGQGKVEEIAGIAGSAEANLVLFDHDLSPTQLRNLEAAL